MKTGVAYLAVAGTAIVWSAVAAQLVTRVGVKPVLVIGMAMLTAGLLYFTQVSVDGSYVGDLLPGFLLIGVGIGFSFVPISIAALAGVQPAEAGLASGLINTSQQIGGALGIAALSTIATSQTEDAVAQRRGPAGALVDGFTSAFLVGAVVAALGLVAALTLIRRDELDAGDCIRAGGGAGARRGLNIGHRSLPPPLGKQQDRGSSGGIRRSLWSFRQQFGRWTVTQTAAHRGGRAYTSPLYSPPPSLAVSAPVYMIARAVRDPTADRGPRGRCRAPQRRRSRQRHGGATWVSLVSSSPSALMRVKAMELPSGDQEDDSTHGQSSVAGTTTELWPVVRSWTQRPSSQA